MRQILHHSLQEISLLTYAPPRPSESHESAMARREKAIRFGESIFGRELLRSIAHHNCERGCDSFTLSFAEQLATKRPYNPRGLGFFVQQMKITQESEIISSDVYRQFLNSSPTIPFRSWFVCEWLNGFLDLGLEVLHGEEEAREAFGDGYFYAMWEEFVKQVRILSDDVGEHTS